MSETFYISDEKLGFTLNKEKNTPTIGKITEGGAFEKNLIDRCSSITNGCEIISIDNNQIIGLDYDNAVKKIKSIKNRPVEITIKSPKSSISKISTKEMNKISKETTENALRDLAKSQLEKKENIISSDESDTDDSYTNMSDNNYVSVKEYNKIEEKCRMQELKIMNTEISFNDEMKYFSNKLNPILDINDIILQIDNLRNKINKSNTNMLTSREIKECQSKVNKEFNDIIKNIDIFKKQIEYHGIIVLIDNYIDNTKIIINKHNNYLIIKFIIKFWFEWFQFISVILVGIMFYYIYKDY
tara:strand:- start:7172 stop:8071 length:900 start_codon:yes stop_codon:yes gene_type:complete